jgi:hypothetical protein
MNNSIDTKKGEAIFNPLGRGNKKSNVKYNDPKPDLNERMKEKARDLDNKDYPGDFSFAQEISEQENKPMEKIRVADGAASWRDFQAPFNDPTENEYLTPTQKKKLQMIKNPIGRGPQMNKNMKQVNSKGSGFPMIQPNQNAAEQQMPQQMPNRAGRSVESNQLVNDPNVNQPMNKVPASSFQRNAQFGDIASSPGVPNPAPMPNTIPQTSVFPQQPNQQQGAFAAYSSPDRVQNTEAGSVINAGRNMQEGIEDLGDSFSKKEDETNNGLGMYDGPSKALVGNQDRLPEHLKAKIEAAPGMYDGPSMKSAFKAFENDHLKTKVTKGNLKATERDDAAHMSYLKRDVKYDNTHGGSNKQMLNDEKHISKLAGDLKYDAKKKRS